MEDNIFENNLYDILGQDINVPKSFTNTIQTFEYQDTNRLGIRLYRKLAIVFSLLILSINLIVYAYKINENYKASSSFGLVNGSLKEAVQNQYIQNVDMEYAYSNNMGVKVDYIIMSDYNLNILFNFDIKSQDNINREANITDLLIYDENNNVIFCYDNKTYKEFCKKNKIKYQESLLERQYTNGYGMQLIELTTYINKSLYTLRSIKAFPKSKKLYIQFKTIYFDVDKTKMSGNWQLELDLNEQFFQRKSMEYQLKETIENITLLEAKSTETTMRITYKINNIDINRIGKISMYLEDSFGNRYDVNVVEDSITVYDDIISATFPITTKNNLKYLILYISLDEKDYFPIVLEANK